MNTFARNILSTLTGLGLVAYVAFSAMTAGFASTEVVLGISGLVAWALAHMIMLDLAPRPTALPIQTPKTVRPVRAPVLLAFPGGESAARRAA